MTNFLKLLNRETTRKEFLILLGLFVLSASGIAGALKNLSSFDLEKNKRKNNRAQTKKTSHGFSRGAYGV